MKRRFFVFSLLCLFLAPSQVRAHSPWGQYHVYRKKHLLILSTRDDEHSYPFSKQLVDCLEATLPTAKARPARAIDLERAYNLLRTDQFQFALLSKRNVEMMRRASGRFVGKQTVNLKTVLEFEDLALVVRGDFPAELVAMVAHGIVEGAGNLSIQPRITASMLQDPDLHEGAAWALSDFVD